MKQNTATINQLIAQLLDEMRTFPDLIPEAKMLASSQPCSFAGSSTVSMAALCPGRHRRGRLRRHGEMNAALGNIM